MMSSHGCIITQELLKVNQSNYNDAIKRKFCQQQNRRQLIPDGGLCFVISLRLFGDLLFLHFGVAFAALNGTVFSGTERHFRFGATGRAGGREHFAVGSCAVLSCVAAGLAPLGLVDEASLSVEFLFTGGENEFRSTFFAC
jgi:hypothetical protein